MNNKSLYGYIFIYNPYRETWEAAKREHYYELFSGDMGNVLRSSNIDTLVELINKTQGDKNKINKLLNNGK